MVSVMTNLPKDTDFETWLDGLHVKWRPDQANVVEHAFEVASECDRERKNGNLVRSLAVVGILADLRMDHEVMAAALLYEVMNTNHLTLQKVKEDFGAAIAGLVNGITKLDVIGDLHQQGQHAHKQLERLRKMLLAMAQDVRVVLIKLAIRLQWMRSLGRIA